MGTEKIFIALLAGAVVILLSISAWAALPSFMWVEGETQGQIEGSSDLQGREGAIIVYAFGHSLKVPTDAQSGQSTGARQYSPFKILKTFDKASPKLYRACATGEHLKKVTLKFYQISAQGVEEHYFTIELEDAIIVNISPSMPTTFLEQNAEYRHMETVSFTFRRITWTWIADGIEFQDDWAYKQ